MLTPSRWQRLAIAARAYAAVVLFGLAVLALRHFASSLSQTEILILSGLLAAPLVLALFWEHLKGFKVGQLEITLAEVSLRTDIELAAAVQDLRGSETPALVHTVAAAIERGNVGLVEVNLRSAPYWWSTRLYLLAALTEEYTDIDRLLFVEQNAARIYIGMAAPVDIRRALARRFPVYEEAFRRVQGLVHAAGSPLVRTKVESIGSQWPSMFQPTREEQVKVLVAAAELREWLAGDLETDSREWDGSPASHALYAKILTCEEDYVPLLRGPRLEKVVNRRDLACRIAGSVLA
jgi:hypothetical protein